MYCPSDPGSVPTTQRKPAISWDLTQIRGAQIYWFLVSNDINSKWVVFSVTGVSPILRQLQINSSNLKMLWYLLFGTQFLNCDNPALITPPKTNMTMEQQPFFFF